VAALFRAGATVPEALFYPLLDAAIDESDPSFNQYFVTPCVKTFGPRRANEYLLSVLESGATRRKAGAVQALYWADVGLSFPRTVPAYTPEYATAESRKAYDNFSDMRNRKNLLYLETFVSDTDLGVRRSIIPGLDLDPNAYPESHREMLTRAISIARESTDDYIRHRVEVQLGARVPLKPRPPLQ
jgi:hypothetical protein